MYFFHDEWIVLVWYKCGMRIYTRAESFTMYTSNHVRQLKYDVMLEQNYLIVVNTSQYNIFTIQWNFYSMKLFQVTINNHIQ